jgi:hypothetical protein
MDIERTTDGDNAFGALVEGDATLAMLGYVAARAGVSLHEVVRDRTQLEASLGGSPDRITGALRAAPAIVREPLLFRYRTGAMFAASLFQHGDWEAVNLAHAHVPTDTMTVMAPQLDRASGQATTSPARTVDLPDLAWLGERGYRLVDEDVLGSLEFGVALGLHEPGVAALVRSWRGDRYGVLEHNEAASPAHPSAETDASIWCLRFSSASAAHQAQAKLSRMPDASGLTRQVLQVGALVLVARGLPAAENAELFARFTTQARRQAQTP